MRKLILSMLFILMIISAMLFYSSYKNSKTINDKITTYKTVDVEKIKKDKQDELAKLKEENKSKYERYEDIEKWNKEVVDYLK